MEYGFIANRLLLMLYCPLSDCKTLYDTDSGGFTQRDSYEGEISNPLTLHKYLYAHGNPASFTDPSGLLVLDLVAARTLDNSIEVR